MSVMDEIKPVRIPVQDVLDLHTFLPRDIPDLLNEYLTACFHKGIASVRLIHGKGSGYQRDRVHGVLKKHPLVASFEIAPPEGGGWGATVVALLRK